jgi:hypothetical protein
VYVEAAPLTHVKCLVWFDMVRGKRIPTDADPPNAQPTEVPSVHVERAPGPKHRWVRRPWAAAAWIIGCMALFAFYLRISFAGYVTSDGANSALQAWDMLHGHLLLHGWIIGSATYYTLDLPVLAVTEIFFGLGDLTSHVASALTYLIVTVSAVALALTDSRGLARVARCGVVVAVLAAMFHVVPNAPYLLGPPDHTGTSAFLLVSFLLIDRAPARRFAPPLLCAILCAGQIGDATVSYVAVPAVVVACGYRAVAARSFRTGDAANALAAAASVPLASAVRAVMLHVGAYQMIAPEIAISRPGQWPHNAAFAWQAIRVLFGAEVGSGSSSLTRDAGYMLGLACLLAAAAGFARVAVTWRTASRAEQLLCAAIVINISAYVISTMPGPTDPWEIVAVLPCGAVLAARAWVPGHIAGTLRTGLTAGLALIAALVPLTVAAVQPAAAVPTAPLSAWLRAHGLTYGLAGYWSSSVITLHSGNEVQVRAVTMRGRQVIRYDWETDISWFDASRHDATFVIIDLAGNDLSPSAESYFGKPVKIEYVASWAILIYQKNLLRQVAIAGTGRRSLLPPGATTRPRRETRCGYASPRPRGNQGGWSVVEREVIGNPPRGQASQERFTETRQ